MQDSAVASPVAIVGAGAVGSTFARQLVACGYRVQAVLSRQAADAQALADRVGASVAGDTWEELPADVRLVVICVPDEEIGAVAEGLSKIDHPWPDTVVAHTSGAQTADVLAPLAQQGAASLSFHPLQTFTPETSPEAFEGIVVGLEGDDHGVGVGDALARALGARPVRLTAEGKVYYHCAAVLASNGLVALMSVVQEVLVAADTETSAALDFVAPLVEQTWANLERGRPEEVITGPVARGDRETVETHLEALADTTPHLLPLYVALSTEMARVAVRGGKLDRAQVEGVLEALQADLPSSTNSANPPSPSH